MSSTEEIKAKIDIVEFLKGYLEVQSAGKNIKARCPFHNEKTPSFMISPERQTWRCFGCGKNGDIFTFLMEYEHIEFYEALKMLAEKSGVSLREYAPAEQRQLEVLFEINEAAKDFFVSSFAAANHVRAYTASRHLTTKTCEEFSLGFAPQGSDACIRYLIGKKFSMQDIVRAGLALRGNRGGYFDRFQNRLMFPIQNHFGKVVGFTGRALAEHAEAKYLNTLETPIFKKSKILYGFHKSKEHIRQERSAFLVEGQMDFLMAWQDGVQTAVATSGTALTPDHLITLKRHADTLIISFDNDEAGWAAGERAISMAHAADFDTRVLLLANDMKDPADIVAAQPGTLKTMVARAQPAIKLFFQKYPITADPIKSKVNIRMVLHAIRSFSSAIDRGYWIREIATLSGVAEEDLKEEMQKETEQTHQQMTPEPPRASTHPQSRHERIANHLVSAAIAENNIQKLHTSEYFQYLPVRYQEIVKSLAGETLPTDPQLQSEIALLTERAGLEEYGSTEELQNYLEVEYRKARSNILLQAIRMAEQNNDHEKIDRLVNEMNMLKSESSPG